MRQLTMTEARAVEWLDVPEPDLRGPGEALVRPLAVALCDLDRPILTGEAPIPGPIAIGHEFVAEVAAVGDDTRAVVGDRVVVPFQISCGTCENCRLGLTANCATVPERSMYGFGSFGNDWGGALSDLVRVPFADHMLVPLPDGLDPVAVASASDNIPDGYRAVAPGLAERPGAEVLVIGGLARSIGLYAVAVARALGSEQVVYMDTDPGRLAVAERLGAEVVDSEPPRKHGRFPITVDASGTHDGLHCALRSTAPGGHCTAVGIFFEPETPMPLLEMYTQCTHFHTGRVQARPQMAEVLDLIAAGKLHPEAVTSTVAAWDDAADAVLEPEIKLVVTR
jgi:alcohol dehydrogenase